MNVVISSRVRIISIIILIIRMMGMRVSILFLLSFVSVSMLLLT